MQHAINTYRTQQVMTASPAQLVSMLYERALRALRDTRTAIEAGDIAARHRHNMKAHDIISHLWSTLDTERGGEVAANLSRLYPFMLRRLQTVDIKNDTAAIEDVMKLLEPLAASWRELASSASAPATGSRLSA